VQAFLEAINREERAHLAAQFSLLVTAQRGDSPELKRVLKELAR
jgi:hypothetical protein